MVRWVQVLSALGAGAIFRELDAWLALLVQFLLLGVVTIYSS